MPLVEIAEMLEAEMGASFAPSSVWRFLDRHAITFKKTAHAAEQDRPDVAAAREAWRELAPRLDPDKLVFIDETGCPYRKSNPAASRRRTRVVWPSSEYAPGTAPFPARKSAIIKLTHLFLQRPAFWPSSLIFDMNGEAKTASTKQQ